MNIRWKQAFFLAILTSLPAMSIADEEPDENLENNRSELDVEESARCVNSRTIKRTSVIDDRNIVFYMRGSKVYINVLPRECRGLSHQRRFSYTTVTRSLCSSDSIRVLRETGYGIEEGRSCRLGLFHPTTEEQISAYKQRSLEVPEAKPPTLPEPQEVTSEGTSEKKEEEQNLPR
jgi:hypothetical protein